jgi:hypothetical protein
MLGKCSGVCGTYHPHFGGYSFFTPLPVPELVRVRAYLYEYANVKTNCEYDGIVLVGAQGLCV